MSAQNLVPSKIVDGKITRNKSLQSRDSANTIALGIVFLVLAIAIMSGVLIFMCMSGGAGESTLFIGIAPFILMFMGLILYK